MRIRKGSHSTNGVSEKNPHQSGSAFEEYFEGYYNLDVEDSIAKMLSRFSYHSVLPNEFCITTEDTVPAKEKEMKRSYSMKIAYFYMTGKEELQDLQTFRRRAASEALAAARMLTLLGQHVSHHPSRNHPAAGKEEERRCGLASESAAKIYCAEYYLLTALTRPIEFLDLPRPDFYICKGEGC